jgi:hypothetical protein
MTNSSRVLTATAAFKFIISLCAVFLFTAIIASNIAEAQTSTPAPACDMIKKHSCEELVQDNILWRVDAPDAASSKHWRQINLDSLCACTADPYATVNCFQVELNNNRKTWQEAIAAYRAKP